MIDEIKDDTETRMEKSVAALETAFARIRTGRASPALLDDIKIDYYGTPTPLNQVASVTVEESRALLISPWEKKLVPQIERAILKSDLGLTPNATADVIRLPMPPIGAGRGRRAQNVHDANTRIARSSCALALHTARRTRGSYRGGKWASSSMASWRTTWPRSV